MTMISAAQTPSPASRAFDSLAYAKHMEAVGFTRQQAEALAEEQGKLIDERLATKVDIEQVKAGTEQVRLSLKNDIEQLRLATKADIAESKADIIKWMIGISFAQATMIVALLKFHG